MVEDLVPDSLWERVAPLLPARAPRRRRFPGRLPVNDRVALAGIVYVLRTGITWNQLPPAVIGCSGVTCWRRVRDWTEAGVVERRLVGMILERHEVQAHVLTDHCEVDRLLGRRRDRGLVDRTVVPTMPVTVRYRLTPQGRDLLDSLQPIAGYAHRWESAAD